MVGTWRPPPGSPANVGTEARGETAGAAPRIGAAGRLRPVLLTAGLLRGPVMLSTTIHRLR